MTDAEFEAFMARLGHLAEADAQGRTRIGRLYKDAGESPASYDHRRDHETYKHNDEWTKE